MKFSFFTSNAWLTTGRLDGSLVSGVGRFSSLSMPLSPGVRVLLFWTLESESEFFLNQESQSQSESLQKCRTPHHCCGLGDNACMGALPQVVSRSRSPGHGVCGVKPPELKIFSLQMLKK